jgi:hypothetical protein
LFFLKLIRNNGISRHRLAIIADCLSNFSTYQIFGIKMYFIFNFNWFFTLKLTLILPCFSEYVK